MPTEPHELHCLVREIVRGELPNGCDALFDVACLRARQESAEMHLPLYSCDARSIRHNYCSVDGLVLKDGMVSVILEVEESGVRPTKICGKFLTSALASYYIHSSQKDEPTEILWKMFYPKEWLAVHLY